MRVFTLLGVVFTVIGVGLVIVAFSPGPEGVAGEAVGMGAGIAAITLLPMGIIFTIIGVAASRASGGRRRLLETGIPGLATILSVSGGNVVVNNINVLLTFHLRVTLPGRSPYDVDHRQLTSMFQMASLQVGAVVPVMVDPTDPGKLTLDLAGEGAVAAARSARPVSGEGWSAPVQPNTLSTMGAVSPNTISAGSAGVPGTPGLGMPMTSSTGAGPTMVALDPAALAAVAGLLGRAGISIDTNMVEGAQVTLDSATIDLRPGVREQVLATGRPGTALIRSVTDTGVNVRGESLVRLTLDVTPDGGTVYQAETGGLLPDAVRARAVPGALVPVRIDPSQPTNVVVDWASGP